MLRTALLDWVLTSWIKAKSRRYDRRAVEATLNHAVRKRCDIAYNKKEPIRVTKEDTK